MGSVKQGWNGRFFEDFHVGDIYRSRLGRTITETDNIQFTMITNNTNQIHFNAHYASLTEFKKPLVNSALTLSVVAGLGVSDLSENGFALGWDYIKLPNPVFPGDTLYSESEVISVREFEVASCAGSGEGAHPRAQSGRGGGDRVRALDHGVEEGACTADGPLSRAEACVMGPS